MSFDTYHPVINLIYFVYVIVCTSVFRHPFFVAVSFISSFVYSSKLLGKKAILFNIVLTILTVPCSFWYAFYTHFGVTVLRHNFIGNNITLESLVYGFILSFTVASIIMWMECVHKIMTADKWIYLLGRISPKGSLYLSIILRTVPRIKARFQKIETARRAVGKGRGQGNFFVRIINFFKEISMTITWMGEDFVTVSDSMRSRGYTLHGRSAFSIYRFDNRDRAFVLIMFFTISCSLSAFLLDQTSILYNPRIIFNPMTLASYLSYFIYMLSCLLPMISDIIWERSYFRSIASIDNRKSGNI